MVKLKLKINVNLLQLLCVVVSVALHGEFERFCEFCVDCYYTLKEGVVSKTKTPKTKTRRPKTYENEDLRKRRPTKTKTPYDNEDPPFFEAVGSTCSILNPSKVRSPSCTAYLWVPEYMT